MLFQLREKKFYANNSEISEIEQALQEKYKYLSQLKSTTQIHREAIKIFKTQRSNTNFNSIEQAHFSSYFENVLFHKFIIIKVVLALPLFVMLTFYLQPLVRYIFERIIMAVIVIIGVIISVFTILYFSPLDAAYSILGQNATKAQIHQFNVLHHLNEPYFIQLWDTIKGVLRLI